MTIESIINLAKNSELKNLAVKDDKSAITGYINLGMLELYKRFPLSVNETVIELLDGVEIYTMPSDFMWIVAAYDEVPEDSGLAVMPIPINEEDNPLSINTISWNQIQVPLTVTGAYISIIYVAAPAVIEYVVDTDSYQVWNSTTSSYDAITELSLPPQMIEPLLHYIGYRAHGAVNGEINGENTTHYMNFEASCNRLEQRGMFTSDDLSMLDRYNNGVWA